MKAKLLKRIRKYYSIEYYPNKELYKFKVLPESEIHYYSYISAEHTWHSSVDSAKEEIIKRLRIKYYKYSRKYKQGEIKSKVWYLK